MLVTDAKIEFMRGCGWSLFAISYRGHHHIEADQLRQDAYQIYDSVSSGICLAVADGLSSGKESQLGATSLCSLGVKLLSESTQLSADQWMNITGALRERIVELSIEESLDQADLATTLQLMRIASDGKIEYLKVGDGGCILSGSKNRWLGKRHNDFVGVNSFSDANVCNKTIVDTANDQESSEGFMIFTDGLEPIFFENEQIKDDNVSKMMQILKECPLGKAVSLLNSLLWSSEGELRDDKTIIIGIRSRKNESSLPISKSSSERVVESSPQSEQNA